MYDKDYESLIRRLRIAERDRKRAKSDSFFKKVLRYFGVMV